MKLSAGASYWQAWDGGNYDLNGFPPEQLEQEWQIILQLTMIRLHSHSRTTVETIMVCR